MNLSRTMRIVTMSLGLAMVPTAAYAAVNVSSNDGYGDQARTTSYSAGAAVNGHLRSTAGKTVFYAGKVILGGNPTCTDVDKGRYSTNTADTNEQRRGGTFHYNQGQLQFHGGAVRGMYCPK